jgi:hypothetical protein
MLLNNTPRFTRKEVINFSQPSTIAKPDTSWQQIGNSDKELNKPIDKLILNSLS